MSGKRFVQRRRKAVTWVFTVLLGALLVLSESHWDVRGVLLADVLFLTGLILIGIATVGRLWCSLYISGYKSNTLIMVGPYSLCRNPLYAFSFLGGIGVGLSSETVTVALVIAAAFLLYYPLVVRAEEKGLRGLYGADFEQYLATIPRFWPSFRRFREPEEYRVKPKVFRRAVWDAMFFVWIAGGLELLEALHTHQTIRPHFWLY